MNRLRTQLLLIVLLAMLPALVFQVYDEVQARRARQQLVRDEALRLVRLVSAEQRRIIEGAESVLDTIAGAPSVQDGIHELCQRLLINLVRTSPRYNAAAVIGRDGRTVCFSAPFDRAADASDRAYFRRAMQTGGFAIGDYMIGRGTGKPGIGLAKPFTTADGAVGGVVELTLSTDWLGRQLDGLALPPGANAAIIDRNGTILAHSPNGARLVGRPVPADYRFALDGAAVGVGEMTSLDGHPMIVGYSPPGAAPGGLLVTVGLDREVTFAAVAWADRIGQALIVLGAALAFATTLALGDRLIGRPVRSLLAAAEQWRAGALAARTGLRADGGEFGRLGAAFDGMAAALAERERASRASDAALRHLTEELETRVGVEVAAREAAQVRAAHAERMQALGQLAGGVAHDFNNVLQAVIGAASLIEKHPDDGEGVGRFARRVLEASERGAAITHRLLAFARRGDLRAEALDVAALLGNLGAILAHTLGSAIDLRIDVADGVAPLLADKGQLETVLINLATNARDAMPGGGRLTISAATETVAGREPALPAGLAPGRYVRIDVADTGGGMDAATLARADEPFFTTKAPGKGTGLGLSMARGVAEQSGGTFAIASRLGLGTTVTLWLPEADSAARDQPPVPSAMAVPADAGIGPARKHVRLLLVDDDDAVREVVAMYLEDTGYDVRVATNGGEALALLADGTPVDALVTDLSMPGMDGLAVIREAQRRRPGLPAILLTGFAGDTADLALHGVVTGSFSLLHKPIRGPALADRIDALLQARAKVG